MFKRLQCRCNEICMTAKARIVRADFMELIALKL